MEAIRQWAFAICAAGTACALVQLISPKTPVNKLLRAVTSIFLLCSMLAPIVLPQERFTLDLQLQESHRQADHIARILEEQMNTDIYRQAQEQIAQEMAELLEGLGIAVQQITLKVNTLADGRIEIYGVGIVMQQEMKSREAEVIELLRDTYGIKADVQYRS